MKVATVNNHWMKAPRLNYPGGEPIVPTPLQDGTPFSWSDLGAGVVGAVVGAGIEGVGITATAVIFAPMGAFNFSHRLGEDIQKRGLVRTLAISLSLPVLASLALPLAPLVSAAFGAYRGFVNGAENGIGAAAKTGLHDVKNFYDIFTEDLYDMVDHWL